MNTSTHIKYNELNEPVVFIEEILYKGRQNIDWDDVEQYLKRYVKRKTVISTSNVTVYIASDFPDEYSGSKYTAKLKGTLAKAKANAVQGIIELVSSAYDGSISENKADKHRMTAKYGWHRYCVKFALPVYNESGEKMRYNVFKAELILRHSFDGNLYLYDMINIKKETGTPLEP